MQPRKVGPFEVKAIGLGCMSMSHAYGTPDIAEAEVALHKAWISAMTFSIPPPSMALARMKNCWVACLKTVAVNTCWPASAAYFWTPKVASARLMGALK